MGIGFYPVYTGYWPNFGYGYETPLEMGYG